MPVKKHFHLLIFFIPGGLFTGGMAYFVQGNAFGFGNITLLALLPAFMVGATVAVIISYLVSRSQDNLRKAKEAAEEANRAKSEFLSLMSHELRTPMNAILGFAQMLDIDSSEPLSERQKSFVDHILVGGKHLMELIDQILELNKIAAGKLSINFEDIPVQGVIDECLQLIQLQAREEGVEILNQNTGETLPNVWTDGFRLTQALANLMSNAVKYNRDEGVVTLRCQETSERMLRICVAGISRGITQDKQEQLITASERPNRENGSIEGTGVGLTITKQLVELLGGKVGYQSIEGAGSILWIDVPMGRDQMPDQKIAKASSS